jgi:hypothetical protein
MIDGRPEKTSRPCLNCERIAAGIDCVNHSTDAFEERAEREPEKPRYAWDAEGA